MLAMHLFISQLKDMPRHRTRADIRHVVSDLAYKPVPESAKRKGDPQSGPPSVFPDSDQSPFSQADDVIAAPFPNDQMIQHPDIQQLQGLHQSLGNGNIRRRGRSSRQDGYEQRWRQRH